MKHTILFLMLAVAGLKAQDPSRFEEEIEALAKKYDTIWDSARKTVVFTGSSSIRFWQDLPDLFPDHQIVNTGFGGSQTSDLLVYSDDLILRYRPEQVFIYEGDNDLNDAKKPRRIIKETRNLIRLLRHGMPEVRIVIIAAKPSPARWHLQRQYRRLNRKFKRLCRRRAYVEFADVWTVMLNGEEVRDDLFIEDQLHMNDKGYQLWYDLIKYYIN